MHRTEKEKKEYRNERTDTHTQTRQVAKLVRHGGGRRRGRSALTFDSALPASRTSHERMWVPSKGESEATRELLKGMGEGGKGERADRGLRRVHLYAMDGGASRKLVWE